jgi:hypothetical protein
MPAQAPTTITPTPEIGKREQQRRAATQEGARAALANQRALGSNVVKRAPGKS